VRIDRRWMIPLVLCGLGCETAPPGSDSGRLDGGRTTLADGRVLYPDAAIDPDAGPPPPQIDGWLDLASYLVPSDGSRSVGRPMRGTNETRDRGTKIVYLDAETGDQASAEVYWWDGARIVDSAGSAINPDSGEVYGADPLEPNLAAIRPFRELVRGENDARLFTHEGEFDNLAGGFPDWFLFRRGQVHTNLDGTFVGGRSSAEPMVVAAYGPVSEPRPRIEPARGNPFDACPCGADGPFWYHVVFASLDIGAMISNLSLHDGTRVFHSGEPPSVHFEDCRFTNGPPGSRFSYTPERTTIRRSVIGFAWDGEAHNQGYYQAGAVASTLFEEVIFYKNGYKTDPRREADPQRDIFSRNVYEGGGARMGHTYRGVIFADGASGGPQMRYGGLCENSLVIEGYWFSSTNSNSPENPWPTIQAGQSALVRNNVQLVFAFPTPADPDSGASDERAQPGTGYALLGSSFGAIVEGNIISAAMLLDDLGVSSWTAPGLEIRPGLDEYPDGIRHGQLDNVLRNNIVYRMGGLGLGDDWADVSGNMVENNVFVGPRFVSGAGSGAESDALVLRNNRYYGADVVPSGDWVGSGNTVGSEDSAASEEGWPDPDRTLLRYVTEVLGLTLLDWEDDPMLDPAQRDARAASGEAYDPTGLKTFMAVATNMRRGGPQPIPSSGPPSWTADYPWDPRFTAIAVVNWIRAGFALPALD
jgi:hypothetical protein